MKHRRREDRIAKRRFREQPISRLLPNMVTISGLCCGLTAIRFAMLGRFEIAVGLIIAAAIIDGMDGRIARMLGATSSFGAQLDSLSDFVCFGVAPALVMYLWQLQDIKGLGWAVVLFFSVCAALRLARFNTGLYDDSKPPWEAQFFTGVPSPAGGILCLLPLIISLEMENITIPTGLSALYVLLIGGLMASRIPTFAGKNIRIKHEYIPHFMIACSFLLVLFTIEPWLFIPAISLCYLATIPLSVRKYRILKTSTRTSPSSPE
jgi:CDP-diacylglycerol---serine O-phosphatidyltransferase